MENGMALFLVFSKQNKKRILCIVAKIVHVTFVNQKFIDHRNKLKE